MNARIVGETFRHEACLDPDLPVGRPLAADAFRTEAAALAAITSRYEDARARIISADSSASAEPERAAAAPAAWSPTVPVDLGSGLPRPPHCQDLVAAPLAPSGAVPGRRRNALVRAVLTWLGTDVGHALPAPLLPY